MSFRPSGYLVVAAWFAFGVAALAEPPPDPQAMLTIQIENDSTRPGSDNYYTSGERIAYTSPTGYVPVPLANLGHLLLGPGQQRMGLELSQNIYTPYADKLSNPPLNDRPYAAVLLGSVSLIQDTDNTRTGLSIGLGVIGPAALGEEVQNGFHTLIGQGSVHGWHTQIGNQPVIQLAAERIWRLPIGTVGGLEADVLPAVSVGAGTFRIEAQAGGVVRIGRGLNADFGAPRIHPGLTGMDAYVSTLPLSWYVYAGVSGAAVAWDETLDGLPFATSRHVSRSPFVGEFQAGVALIAGGVRVTASQIVRSNEFHSQVDGPFTFTSVAVAFKF